MTLPAETILLRPAVSRCSGESALKIARQVEAYFQQYRGVVYHYLAAVYGNRADAEEITQEAFLALFRFLSSGRAVHNVRNWVLRVAHNLAVQRQICRSGESSTQSSDELAAVVELRPAPGPDPEDELLLKERWKRLGRAWSALTPQQRHCMRLRVEGLPYREIGEVLGISISTVVDSLERSVAKLRKEIHG